MTLSRPYWATTWEVRDVPIYADLKPDGLKWKATASMPANENMVITSIELHPVYLAGSFEDLAMVFVFSEWRAYCVNQEYHSKFNGIEFIDLFNRKFQRRKLDTPLILNELVYFAFEAAFLSERALAPIQGSIFTVSFHGTHSYKK